MNIEQLKKNLRKTNLNMDISNAVDSRTPLELLKKKTLEPSPLQYYNQEFEEKEEEEKPNSQYWEDDDYSLTMRVGEDISDLGLEDKKFDWRTKTSKGKKSHRNFGIFLKDSFSAI
jgi:hypothetical protein